MKKHLIMTALLLSCCLSSFGQQVTKFMGIPVDGTKKEMIQKLEGKGFERVPGENYLEGEFNGEEVWIYIHTDNNKVWRICVADKSNRNEQQIKRRFNNLYYQFKDNKRYMIFGESGSTIPEDDDIGYQMEVNNKEYQATFYQADDHIMNEKERNNLIYDFIEKKYGIDSLTIKEFQKEGEVDVSKIDTAAIKNLMIHGYGMTAEQYLNSTPEEWDSLVELGSSRIAAEIYPEFLKLSLEKLNRPVWFTIMKVRNTYRLAIYYENGYNKANGEDL